MIEINLLSEESRQKRIKLGHFDPSLLKYLIPIAGAILIIINIYFIWVSLSYNSRLSAVEKKWNSLEKQRKEVEEFRKTGIALNSKEELINKINDQRILFSQKLNRLSMDLPSGVWFSELDMSKNKFELRGSAVSVKKDEISLINAFLEKLKQDEDFFKDFSSISIDSLKSRNISSQEIVDFLISGKLKEVKNKR